MRDYSGMTRFQIYNAMVVDDEWRIHNYRYDLRQTCGRKPFGEAALLCMVFLVHANNQPGTVIKTTTFALADWSGLSVWAVRSAIRRLVDAGIVERNGRALSLVEGWQERLDELRPTMTTYGVGQRRLGASPRELTQ